MPYRRLNSDSIVRTIDRLSKRISERFPGRGLAAVGEEFASLAQEEVGLAETLTRPRFGLRVLVTLLILASVIAIAYLGWTYRNEMGSDDALTKFESLEALINIVLLSGAAIFFLLNLEARQKRSAVLARIDQLRSIAHVIDMHQLTKDPTVELYNASATPSSPDHDLTGDQLVRYLDYCAEMLALTGKLAALYLEFIKDPVIIATVNDFETLTSDLSRKVWQKISVLEPALASRDYRQNDTQELEDSVDENQLDLDLPSILS